MAELEDLTASDLLAGYRVTQQLAASVRCGLTSAGLPMGLQVMGPRHGDGLVLRAARSYEREVQLPTERPAPTRGGAQ